jgi:hypothetical protein
LSSWHVLEYACKCLCQIWSFIISENDGNLGILSFAAGLLEIKGQHFGGCKIIASTPDESASLIYVSWLEKVSTSSNWFPTNTSIYIISIVLTYMKHLEENVFSSHFCFLTDNKDRERQFGRNVS